MEKWYIFGIFAVFLLMVAAAVYIAPAGKAGAGQVTKVVSTRQPVLEEAGSIVTSKPLPPSKLLFAVEETSAGGGALELAVYNQDFGFVKETRAITMAQGLNLVEFQDVAEEIDPTSVLVKSNKRINVIEQNYEYDLVSSQKLLEKYLGKNITVETEKSSFTGELISYSPVVLRTVAGIVSVSDVKNVIFPSASLPEGFRTKPSLIWKLDADPGEHNIQLSYLTNGITWSADYIADVNYNDDRLDLSGWATVDNQAGMTFPDTKLMLVAGEVNRVTSAGIYKTTGGYAYAEAAAPMAAPSAGVSEQTLYEYHAYTLNTPTTLADNSQKQILFINKTGVPVTKEFVFDSEQRYYYYGSSDSENKIKVMLNFKNSEPLGSDLPAGTIRVYKPDVTGKRQFIGEDSIDHTARDEDVRIFTGYASNITGERKETDYTRISDDVRQYTYQIVLRNHKDAPVQVTVIEYLYGSWTITQNTHPYTKKDANTIEFKPTVPANGNVTIEYTYLQSY